MPDLASDDGDDDGSAAQAPDLHSQMLFAWLKTHTYREERQFLEAHPEMLAQLSEDLLIDLTKRYDGQAVQQRDLRDHLMLLRDIRARQQRNPTLGAIREGYVNARGGMTLDIPPWLEEVERRLDQAREQGRVDQTAQARAELLREALAKARKENLGAEITAQLCVLLWSALDDDRSLAQRAAQEEGLTALHQALATYILARYPTQNAATQSNLGNAYAERITGEQRENLERALEAYQEALRVYTLAAFPIQYAATQNNLGAAYFYRIAGERRENLERAIVACQEALGVRTFDALPTDYAATQNNLGAAYFYRIAGERRENLERALEAYQEALRVRTLDAFPVDYRNTQQNRALAEANLERWEQVAEAYGAALEAEDLLVALAGSVEARDAILREGREAAIRAGYALARIGQFAEAAIVIERGRARGVAEALAQDAADPAQIRDSDRRLRFEQAREALRAAQANLNAPIPLDSTPPPDGERERLQAIERQRRQVEFARGEAFNGARQTYERVITEIRLAQDPEDFAYAPLDAATVLRATQGERPGHAIVYLAATPWGGISVAALGANPRLRATARFAALRLPALTESCIRDLIEQSLPEGPLVSGFAIAQEGSAFDRFAHDWEGVTLRQRAQALHAACSGVGVTSSFDLAAQNLLRLPSVASLTDAPFDDLFSGALAAERGRLAQTFNHLALRYELERCLPRLAEIALRPLSHWLVDRGANSVTLIPCGLLAAFPLAAAEVAPGLTFAELLPTSVAPNARSLLREQSQGGSAERSGVYAAGDPRPTHQELRWGEAEALTIAKIARLLGQPGEAKTLEKARRGWLIEKLRSGWMVDASCHGRFDVASPLDSRLQLADRENGRLTLRDMMSHVADLRGLRLLIFSACETGILDLRGARDEVRSLAVGALQAGADATMAASWAVDDRATYLLMVRFVQEWLPRMRVESPALALARAQQWLRHATVADLRQWEALVVPEVTAEERVEAGSPEPSLDPTVAEIIQTASEIVAQAAATVGAPRSALLAVRGRGERYDIGQAEYLIRADATRQPDDEYRPYEHPYFWAGFQVYGW